MAKFMVKRWQKIILSWLLILLIVVVCGIIYVVRDARSAVEHYRAAVHTQYGEVVSGKTVNQVVELRNVDLARLPLVNKLVRGYISMDRLQPVYRNLISDVQKFNKANKLYTDWTSDFNKGLLKDDTLNGKFVSKMEEVISSVDSLPNNNSTCLNTIYKFRDKITSSIKFKDVSKLGDAASSCNYQSINNARNYINKEKTEFQRQFEAIR